MQRRFLGSPVLTSLLVCVFSLCARESSVSATELRPDAGALQIVNQMVEAEAAANRNREHFAYRNRVRSARTKGHLWEEWVVETPEGRMHRLLAEDGKPLSSERERGEEIRIANLVEHPEEFRREAQARKDDEGRMKTLLQELPRAFLFRIDGEGGNCTRIAFQPNPAFKEETYQDRVIHAMSGVLLVRRSGMRLCGIDAHLDHKVEFGFGLLGEVSDASHFSIRRDEVLPSQWKTTTVRIHVDGNLLLLKSFSRDEDSSHDSFQRVADNLTVAQAAAIARAKPS